ncbi:hypothetical protein ACS0TY_006790 [Phlomoides rotata]
MKILTYNIRGFGSRAKETKKKVVDKGVCRSLWGEGRFGWAYSETVGRSGGIISRFRAGGIWKKRWL